MTTKQIQENTIFWYFFERALYDVGGLALQTLGLNPAWSNFKSKIQDVTIGVEEFVLASREYWSCCEVDNFFLFWMVVFNTLQDRLSSGHVTMEVLSRLLEEIENVEILPFYKNDLRQSLQEVWMLWSFEWEEQEKSLEAMQRNWRKVQKIVSCSDRGSETAKELSNLFIRLLSSGMIQPGSDLSGGMISLVEHFDSECEAIHLDVIEYVSQEIEQVIQQEKIQSNLLILPDRQWLQEGYERLVGSFHKLEEYSKDIMVWHQRSSSQTHLEARQEERLAWCKLLSDELKKVQCIFQHPVFLKIASTECAEDILGYLNSCEKEALILVNDPVKAGSQCDSIKNTSAFLSMLHSRICYYFLPPLKLTFSFQTIHHPGLMSGLIPELIMDIDRPEQVQKKTTNNNQFNYLVKIYKALGVELTAVLSACHRVLVANHGYEEMEILSELKKLYVELKKPLRLQESIQHLKALRPLFDQVIVSGKVQVLMDGWESFFSQKNQTAVEFERLCLLVIIANPFHYEGAVDELLFYWFGYFLSALHSDSVSVEQEMIIHACMKSYAQQYWPTFLQDMLTYSLKLPRKSGMKAIDSFEFLIRTYPLDSTYLHFRVRSLFAFDSGHINLKALALDIKQRIHYSSASFFTNLDAPAIQYLHDLFHVIYDWAKEMETGGKKENQSAQSGLDTLLRLYELVYAMTKDKPGYAFHEIKKIYQQWGIFSDIDSTRAISYRL